MTNETQHHERFNFPKACNCSRRFSVRLKIFMLICFVGLTVSRLHGQAAPTASRVGDLQIGVMFNLADTDYRPEKFKGYGFYSTYDFRYHLGIEGEFHQINDPDATEGIYERTYEIGPRYVLHYGRFAPYAKVMYGRGVFNYPPVFGDPKLGPIANLAYNIFAIGGGVDYHVLPGLNVRAEYEYQQWLSFPPNGLTPKIFSVGAAYRFH
jgi:opacity protein-like surface antigen